MAKKYEAKQPTGREYVDAATALCNYTSAQCSRLPKRWEALFLAPLAAAADGIESETRQANKVWIDKEKMPVQELICAYGERDAHLKTAIGLFADFDVKFDRLMGNIDIAASERRRLTNILYNIIDAEKAYNPELDHIQIDVHSRLDEVEYISAIGDQKLKLRLTAKQRDHWLKLEKTAKDLITDRYRADKKAVSRLKT